MTTQISPKNNYPAPQRIPAARPMSIETIDIDPTPITREEIITKDEIPAEIFDYVDKAFEDPDTFPNAIRGAFWYPFYWVVMRDILPKQHGLMRFVFEGGELAPPEGAIWIVNADDWNNPLFKGPLSLTTAKSAVATVRKLTAVEV
jgi:hypothetical protein